MSGLDVLDVVIGLGFVYLLLSLCCTALNELIAQWWNSRATTLRAAIDRLCGPAFADTLYAHALIAAISQPHQRALLWWHRILLPSYIPSRTFALALYDRIGGQPTMLALAANGTAPQHVPPSVVEALKVFARDAGNDADKFRVSIERWYEDTMESVSGWYKRKTQLVVLLVSLAITVALNADSIAMAREISNNAVLRGSLVAAAQEFVKLPLDTVRATPADTTPPMQSRQALDSAATRFVRARDRVLEIGTRGLAVGWPALSPDSVRKYGSAFAVRAQSAWGHAPGWLLTAIAISLGAPFWFDMLNKVINIRGAGRAPEEKPKPPEALPPARGA